MLQVKYNDPRLSMTSFGRFFIRLSTYVAYCVLGAAAVVFASSDIGWLNAAGWLLVLFLADRAIYFGESERHLVRLSKEGEINAAKYLAPKVYSVIEWAMERALAGGGDFALLLVRRLADNREMKEGLARMDVKSEEFLQKAEEYIEKTKNTAPVKGEILKQIEVLAIAAFKKAIANLSEYIELKDLFAAIGEAGNERAAKLFKLFDIQPEDLENAIIFGRVGHGFLGWRRLPSSFLGFLGKPYKVRHRVMNRAWTARPTPTLDQFGEDLTDLARTEKIGFMIGHEQEYDRMVDVLARPGNPNVLLIGDVGVGKETIISHLAYEMTKDRVPKPLFDKRIVKIDIGALVAGAEEGELQKRLKKIIAEVTVAGNVILYIPEIHNLIKTSGPMRLNAADILLPAIKSTAFSVIGTAYPRDFKQHIEPNSDFTSVFEIIRCEEMSEDETMKLLTYISVMLEARYKMMISFSAVKQAVALAHKYFRQKLLPGSAEDLLKESLSDASAKGRKALNGNDIVDIAQRKINIPLHAASKGEAEKLLNLEEEIHRRLVDQEEAVKAVAQSLREYRSGLSRKGGPIATFLFVGPTGVGKTELSKILSKIQFGSSEVMVRFDMSEFQNKDSISRFLGASDGSFDGALTGVIREKPYSLILLDEFEKAHPDILNLFLQVFDDGRLTDSLSRTVDFQNTIIIATSNAHSNFIKESVENGKEMKEVSDELKKKLTDYFRPELLNRFSGVIVFRTLLPEHIEQIARIQLNDLAGLVAESNGITLTIDEAAVKKVAELGFDPVFGARPLRGVISDKIKAMLAEKILKGELGRGSNISVSVEGDQFAIKQ